MTTFYEELEKNKVIRDDAEDAQSRASVDKWIFRFMLILIGMMPLLVFGHVGDVISPLVSNLDVLSSGVKGELFTHYKALFVVGITIITGVMLLAKIFFMNGSIKKTWLNYVLGVFAIAIIASTVFSPNISIALNGMYNRSDGAISWLCYIALMFIAMNINYPKNLIKYIAYTMLPFVYINLFIITMNFYGKDLLQYDVVSRIVMSTLPEGSSLGENSQLLGTLNQWNYMSGMFAMMTVLYLAWAIVSKSWSDTIIGAITAAASIAIMFMAVSTSGFIAVLGSILVLILVFIKSNFKLKAMIGVALFILITAPTFHILASKDEKVWNESFGFLLNKNPYEEKEITSLHMKNFLESKKVSASSNNFTLPELPKRGWSAGSGRIYIWGKTLDLVTERPIVGYGMDTIMYNFPHYNIDSRAGNNSEDTIVDKVHNSYLAVLHGSGVFGFIAYMLLILTVIGTSIAAIVKYNNIQVAVLFAACFAFFIQAVFNDSIPGMTPLLFVFMGIIFSLSGNLSNLNRKTG